MFTDILSKGTFPIHVYRHLIKRDISHPCLQTSYQKGHFQSMFIDILSKGTFPMLVYRHLIKRDISHPCLQTSYQKGHFPSMFIDILSAPRRISQAHILTYAFQG